VPPAGKSAAGDLRTGSVGEARSVGQQEGPQGGEHAGAGNQEGQRGSAGLDTETEAATEAELGTEVDDRIADAFERDLGIDPDEELEDDPTPEAVSDGPKPVGEGPPGRDVDGRTGDDTRLGGSGPGGGRARPDGQGKGSDTSSKDGSEGGSKDGQHGGVAGGMYGGEGKAGDDGVPSGVALFGGLIGIPAALKGLVEFALIIADGNIAGAGEGLFRKGLGQIASAAVARKAIASAARRAALKELTATIKVIQAHRVRGAIWKAATKAERDTVTRRIYWELQRTYFEAYQKAAKAGQTRGQGGAR
jgi:hypothetical protein